MAGPGGLVHLRKTPLPCTVATLPFLLAAPEQVALAGVLEKGLGALPPWNEEHREPGGEEGAWVSELLRPGFESCFRPFLVSDLGQVATLCTTVSHL